MKNLPVNVPVATVAGRKTKKGNSTRTAKKPRSEARYFEVNIRISADDYARGEPYFGERKYLSKFIADAYMEKVNRAEANNKSARLRILAGNVELLLPVITEMHKQGKLDFLLKERADG